MPDMIGLFFKAVKDKVNRLMIIISLISSLKFPKWLYPEFLGLNSLR